MKTKKLISAYLELTKPRILLLVLITTLLGFYLGGKGITSYPKLIYLLLGAGLVCAGSSALNQYLEREYDSKMIRTKNRPIPLGIISAMHALNFGVLLILIGLAILYWKINLLTAFLSLLTTFLYVLVYTPMKRLSWLNTTIGSIPGALPPMGGWVAATGSVDAGAWVLFLILFFWQHPHFFAIAWMCREDYERGGFKMLPVIEADGKWTFFQISLFSILLILMSVVPTLMGMSGHIYLAGALIAGYALFLSANTFIHSRSHADARKLLRATVIYLPVLLLLIVIDANF
jgi:protoheme IX farnesyltransferase